MILDDAQIVALIDEPKPTVEPASLTPTTRKGSHREAQGSITTVKGSSFRLIVRQSTLDPLDFSVILGYELPETTRVFRLRRHNGNSHDHPNRIEQTVARGFHVHLATERYQLAGYEEDGYAETTNSYSDLAGAIRSMIAVANFKPPRQESLPI
jgi:hypothetical protein